MKEYIVKYRVIGQMCSEDYMAGPYSTQEEAREHYNDIAGFMGIHGVFILELDRSVKNTNPTKRIIEL
jgi:hypothetical protein